jgi:hypothetical protein
VWTEPVEERQAEWRGKVQHITSGEVRYFQGWPALITLLMRLSEEATSASLLEDD